MSYESSKAKVQVKLIPWNRGPSRVHMWTSLVAQRLKRLPPMRETRVESLGRKDPLEKEMAIHSSILAWRIPWKEKPSRLQSMGSQRVWHDWATSSSPSPRLTSEAHHSKLPCVNYLDVGPSCDDVTPLMIGVDLVRGVLVVQLCLDSLGSYEL